MFRQTFISITVVLALATSYADAEILSGVVIGVADGDTLTLLDEQQTQHKVRLAGIDAPEKAQAFGERAKQNLSSMTYGMLATVEANKIDRYGRLVGKVRVNGIDINLRQIEVGMAWVYRAYEREMSAVDVVTYRAAEIVAKARRRGLWGISNPQPPWDFRQSRATGAGNILPNRTPP